MEGERERKRRGREGQVEVGYTVSKGICEGGRK